MVSSNPLKNKFQVTLQLENRLHDIPNGFYYLLLLSCVILDKLQRNSYFSFVEKKQHGISFCRRYVMKRKVYTKAL